jgi:hypothetical protein
VRQNRRGIGKKQSGRSEHALGCFYNSSSLFAAVTVEEASLALQLSSHSARPVAVARKDKSKVRKERDDELKVQIMQMLHWGCTLNITELTAAAQCRPILASGA